MRFAIAVLLALGSSALAAPQPNIVVILADDLGYSDLGCYGGEIATPNLDRLANNGLRYSQCYNTARCWSSRASILTGRYPQQIHRDKLPNIAGGGVSGTRQKWAPLLPELLKPANYRCYHSGKWHIDGSVSAGGFDQFLLVNNPGNYFSVRGSFLNGVAVKPPVDDRVYYNTIATADHAIQCLQDHAQHHREKPFFLYLAFHAPHFPLHALPDDIAKYRDRYLEGWEKLRETRFAQQKKMGLINTPLSALESKLGPPYRYPEAIKRLGAGEVEYALPWSELTPEQQQFQATKMAIHAAMVDRMDREIGRLVGQLNAMKAMENTLLVFASDNGASAEIMVRDGGHDPKAPAGSAATYLCLGPGFSSACNTPFRRHKTWVHEGGISTPLIVHWPAKIRDRGALRHTPTHFIDFVPTVFEMVGIQPMRIWDGRPVPPLPGKSLVPSFTKDVVIARDYLWWLHDNHRAIRVDHWKLVAAAGQEWELYDLMTDRAEQNNLAKLHADRVHSMRALWNKQTEEFVQLIKSETKP